MGSLVACRIISWTALGPCPLHDVQVTFGGRAGTHGLAPRATITPCQFNNIKEGSASCHTACTTIPWAALRPNPLQYFQMTGVDCSEARSLVSGADVRADPFKHLEMASIVASLHTVLPVAAVRPGPFQDTPLPS